VTELFLFREARESDEESILELARHLASLNLPPERPFVRDLLQRSIESFDGRPQFDERRRFLFVLEDPQGRVVGTSMVHAQHGTFDEPHVYFSVTTEERHAALGAGDPPALRHVHMEHVMLTLQQTYAGPTELGGLVVLPELRRHPDKLGRVLSLARFPFIKAFRGWMRDTLLAELLPPLYRGPEGTTASPLWDALGHRFTGLSYAEADRLSRLDKRFIWQLFPRMPVHASLLPEEVQRVIGTVGAGSVGALALLESVGFAYSRRVDPFDGGPHVEAPTDQVTLVRDTARVRPEPGDPGAAALPGLVAVVRSESPHFRAVWAPIGSGTEAGATVQVAADVLRRLAVDPEDPSAQVLTALRPQRRRGDRAGALASGM
jgi:arginine N-succinyltransferase